MNRPPYAYLPDCVVRALPGLSKQATKLSVALGMHMNKAGACYPSRDLLMKEAGIGNTRNFAAAVKQLKEKAGLTVQLRQSGTPIYRWNVANPGIHETATPEDLSCGTSASSSCGTLAHSGIHETATQNIQQNIQREHAPRAGAAGDSAPTGKVNSWGMWIDCWRSARLGSPDPLPTGPDTKAGKELVRLLPDADVLRTIFAAFLADDDAFLRKQGHALRLLPGRVGAYRSIAAQAIDYRKGF